MSERDSSIVTMTKAMACGVSDDERCYFFGLAPELRLRIYELCFGDVQILEIASTKNPFRPSEWEVYSRWKEKRRSCKRSAHPSESGLGLLQSCHQINAEALPILLERTQVNLSWLSDASNDCLRNYAGSVDGFFASEGYRYLGSLTKYGFLQQVSIVKVDVFSDKATKYDVAVTQDLVRFVNSCPRLKDLTLSIATDSRRHSHNILIAVNLEILKGIKRNGKITL